MAKAKKEVILCAGTVGSAKLLLLSGVGPRNQLVKMKVKFIRATLMRERLCCTQLAGLPSKTKQISQVDKETNDLLIIHSFFSTPLCILPSLIIHMHQFLFEHIDTCRN